MSKYTSFASLVVTLMALPSFAATPAATPAATVDVSAESATLDRLLLELGKYDGAVAQANKKEALVGADVDALERRGAGIKSQVSGAQGALSGIVRKLKAANQFDILDELAAKGAPTRFDSLLRGSLKQALLDTASGLDTSEIDASVASLRRRVANPAVASVVRRTSLACRIGTARLGLIKALGGDANDHTIDVVSCACNPNVGFGLATGTSCDAL